MAEGGRTDDIIALPEDRAAALADVSLRQLGYWDKRELVGPGIRRELGPHRNVRLYTFQDLVSLLVTAEMRQRKFSLQQIRKVVNHLRSRGYAEPIRELKFATYGKEIYFQHPSGEWEGGRRPDQIVFYQVIDLEPIRARIRDAVTGRPRDARGKIERRRGRLGNKPVFAGTRIPVDAVVQRLEHGFTEEQVIAAYPDLTVADIEAARRCVASA